MRVYLLPEGRVFQRVGSKFSVNFHCYCAGSLCGRGMHHSLCRNFETNPSSIKEVITGQMKFVVRAMIFTWRFPVQDLASGFECK